MKNKIITTIITLIAVLCSYANNTVNIKQKSCKYSITIPEGWDSIPHDTITKKLGNVNIDLALYKKDSSGYFDDCYILIGFAPTTKSLSQYSFKDIVKGLRTLSKQTTSSLNDTIKVETNEVESSTDNDVYKITTLATILKNNNKVDCLQNLIVTKFGYITVAFYQKGSGSSVSKEVVDKLISQIKIEDDYKYTEPQTESLFSPIKIGITIGIGLLVYFMIIFIDRKRKK
ncbi:MAG: hypothetical protein J5900_05315 [Prevotella sp.]|nr:hypothetical protein [Prevotella sp.]